MASTIKIKNSSVASDAPLAGDLVEAELALNTEDGELYTRNSAAAVVKLGVIKQGGANSNTARHDGTSWITATNFTNDGTDVVATGRLTAANLTLGATAITATGAELNILDGVTSTNAELNILDGVTSTTAELNILDGVTATAVELNYVDGVTSNVQTQLDAKSPIASPTFTGTVVIPTADINGGNIDGTAIGATSASTVVATSLTVGATALTTGFTHFRALTQATYDGLTPDSNTIYFING